MGSNISACSQYVAGVKHASRDRDRITKELVGLYAVLTQVLQLVSEETGGNSRLEPGRTSHLSALNEGLRVCGGEMKLLWAALGDEMDSFEMGGLKAAPDGNTETIKMALGREMKDFEKDLGRKGGIGTLTWLLKEADVSKTMDSIGKLRDLLIMAMEVDQTYVVPDTFKAVLMI